MNKKDRILEMYQEIICKAKKAEKNVIFGVYGGTGIQSLLEENDIIVSYYFDNDAVWKNSFVNGVKVIEPQKISGQTLYIITAKIEKNVIAMTEQLLKLGVDLNDIVKVPSYKSDLSKMSALSLAEREEEITDIYCAKMGRLPDLKSPKLYSEKVNANKKNMETEFFTMLADKYRVKEFIKETLGEQYVVPLLGVWERPEDIDYSKLPDKFVLKPNNASGRNILVQNKSEIDVSDINKKMNTWLQDNYGYFGFSLQYKNIKPVIICEEYLEGLAETVYDYQFFCFDGEPKYIWCIKGSHRKGCRASFYDLDWNIQPFSVGYPRDDEIAPKPEHLQEMIEISRKLSKGIDHVRVDLYDMPDGRILFGEMTFQTWGGFRRFYPPEYDRLMGDLIKP